MTDGEQVIGNGGRDKREIRGKGRGKLQRKMKENKKGKE